MTKYHIPKFVFERLLEAAKLPFHENGGTLSCRSVRHNLHKVSPYDFVTPCEDHELDRGEAWKEYTTYSKFKSTLLLACKKPNLYLHYTCKNSQVILHHEINHLVAA